jgi:hypothetical protein
MFSLLLAIHGCLQQEDKVHSSWNQFVAETVSGDTDFIQELSADMKHHGYWYDLNSADYDPKTGTGTIKLRVIPPVGDAYEVDFEFQQEGDTWTSKGGIQYQEL